jgi:hypothetical protein
VYFDLLQYYSKKLYLHKKAQNDLCHIFPSPPDKNQSYL